MMHNAFGFWVGGATAGVIALIAGCQAPGIVDKSKLTGTRLDALQKTYADLSSGKFAVLADFESPGQELLFRALRRGDAETERQPALSVLRAREETGVGGLQAVFAHAEDRLLLDGQRTSDRAVPRDWTGYALLIFAIYAAQDGPPLIVEISSGASPARNWSARIPLREGWHTARIDLASAANQIDLADVRAVTWRFDAPAGSAPREFFLDDVLLADNTRLLGGAVGQTGALSVTQRGRRLLVESAGRFSLAFMDGMIVEWREGRGANLADSAGLGPWTVPLDEDWFERDQAVAFDDPSLHPAWAGRLQVTNSVQEIGPMRVVLAAHGRAALQTNAVGTATQPPDASHLYTIYPDGRVYVRVDDALKTSGATKPRIGWVVALNGRAEFGRSVGVKTNGATGSALLVRPGRAADLLWLCRPDERRAAPRRREFMTEDGLSLAVALGDVEAAEVSRSVHMLRVWPGDLDETFATGSIVEDFALPAALSVANGEAVLSNAPALARTCFDASEGCYVVRATSDVVRFTYDPGANVHLDPVFSVRDARSRDAWVYAGGRIISTTGRDREGNLLFTLPGVQRGKVLIEVHFRKQQVVEQKKSG